MSVENTTSFDKYAKMYERMKESKPGFNEVSIINQAEPRIMGDNVVSEIDRHVPQQQNPEEDRSTYNEELKQKILDRAKAKGIGIDDSVYNPPKTKQKSSGNLERRVQYLEEALKIVMEQQMKFLREIK